MTTEIEAAEASGPLLRALCWEDADTLLDALEVRSGETVVSVASGPDNTLALLLADPAAIIGVDPNPAQIACGTFWSDAFRKLGHGEFLELIGSRASNRRLSLFKECRDPGANQQATFWRSTRDIDTQGIGGLGTLERELARFRVLLLPFAQGPTKVRALLRSADPKTRAAFFEEGWHSLRWKLLFGNEYSRIAAIVGGRRPGLFDRDEGDGIGRARHLMVDLDPALNPYLHWILRGDHGDRLPLALRARHHGTIRRRLDRISWHCRSLEGVLGSLPAKSVDRFNLGSLFESTSDAAYNHLLKAIVRVARPGARLVYWNTQVRRSRPESMRGLLQPLEALASHLSQTDGSIFSPRLVIEEVCG